jgi:type II secretory pathway pseudopilin PulG
VLKNSKGFTITEALIAVALVGVAITMFGYLISSFSLVRKGQVNSSAINYARTVLDSTTTLWRKDEFYSVNQLPKNLTAPPNNYKVFVTVNTINYPLNCPSTPPCTFTGSPLATAPSTLPTAKDIAITIQDSNSNDLITLNTVIAKPIP